MLPLSFQNLFQTGSQIHNCSTRYAESYRPHASLQNEYETIYNLIPTTEIVKLFTILNNQIK